MMWSHCVLQIQQQIWIYFGLGSVSKRVCVKTLKTVKNFGTQTLYRLLETEEITLSSSSSCVTLCFEVLV